MDEAVQARRTGQKVLLRLGNNQTEELGRLCLSEQSGGVQEKSNLSEADHPTLIASSEAPTRKHMPRNLQIARVRTWTEYDVRDCETTRDR